jgi:hypothetical protein
MADTIKFPASKLGPKLLTFLPVLALLGALAYAQADQKQSRDPVPFDEGNKSSDLAKAPDGSESIYIVQEIVRRGEVQAIPTLEEKFARTKDLLTKEHVASALVRLGDTKDVYWDFLVKQATVAIESGIPDFMGHDSQGKSVPGPSPEFSAWAQSHNLSASAAEQQVLSYFGAVLMLATTRDSRAVPLLRQALSAPNVMIQTAAAQGLAAVQDKGSIPLIIDACKRAPAESGAAIARSLVYFDDPEAQAAVDKYVPKGSAKALREDRAQRGLKTPFD